MVSERDALKEKLSEVQRQIASLKEASRILHDENKALKDQIEKLSIERKGEKKMAQSKPSPKGSESTIKARFYEVKKGDSLWSISRRTGVSIATLKKLNNIKGSQINVGQKLFLTPEGQEKQ